MQRLYSPAAINVDFALITLKTPVTEGTGYFGITRGTGNANLDISSVRDVPVIYLHFPYSDHSMALTPLSSIHHARTYTCTCRLVSCACFSVNQSSCVVLAGGEASGLLACIRQLHITVLSSLTTKCAG